MGTVKSSSWSARFWAWLIDVLLVSIIWYLAAISLEGGIISSGLLGSYTIMLFAYWTALEGYRGQSLGKMVLNLAVVGQTGETIGFKDAAIESFGKAFLLPLDCAIGYLAFRDKGLRLFNHISNTVVVMVDDEDSCAV